MSIPGLDGLIYSYYVASGNVYMSGVCCTDQFLRALRGRGARQKPYKGCNYVEGGPNHQHPEGGVFAEDIKELGVILGVTLRCVLSRESIDGSDVGKSLVEEYDVTEGIWYGEDPFSLRPHLPMIKRCIVDRRILCRYGTSAEGHFGLMDDVGLSVNFNFLDASLEPYARAYEWDHWPDLLRFLGMCLCRVCVYLGKNVYLFSFLFS